MRQSFTPFARLIVLFVSALAVFLGAGAATAAAETYTVDSESDADLQGCDDGVAGDCTFRGAITKANNHVGADTIDFSISPGGIKGFIPDDPLPAIIETVTIDGTTQPMPTGSTLCIDSMGMPCIRLSGNETPPGTAGLRIQAPDVTVTGLAIFDFNDTVSMGIYVTGAYSGARIVRNFIGTNDGASDLLLHNVKTGIYIDSEATNVTIGGTTPSERNLISQTETGIRVSGSGVVIQGNYFGTGLNGTFAASLNNLVDILIDGGDDTMVGGTTPGAANVLAQATGAPGAGVWVGGGSENSTIAGNYIGTNAAGATNLGNDRGVYVEPQAVDTRIGLPGSGNVIASNNLGVSVEGSTGTVIQGNYIGTDKTGMLALPNGSGVFGYQTGEGVLIGGDSAAERNVISGNTNLGIGLVSTEGTVISGNYIGVNAAGTAALANARGVGVSNGFALIGGDSAGERNVISGNTIAGVLLEDAVAGTTVEGNYIGVDATGDGALGNYSGIQLHSDVATTNTNAIEVRNNVISGNLAGGISYDVDLEGQILGGRIFGNTIGLSSDASTKVPNGSDGILIQTDPTVSVAQGIVIDSGPEGDAPNIISGNDGGGIQLLFAGVSGIVVSGNYVGTNEDLAPGLGNERWGVLIIESADNLIEGNVIRNNVGWGVTFDGPGAVRNTVSENSIDNNTQLGIFSDDGAQSNTIPPVLTAAESGSTHVTGTLASAPSTEYNIEFFRSPSCDPSGFGEGRTFIGSTSVTTNGAGTASIDATLNENTPGGQVVTATATDAAGNTSEFSNCVTMVGATASPTPSVTATPTPSATPTPTGAAGLRGDATCNGIVDLDDVIAALSEFGGVDPGADCDDEADVDCDDEVDGEDALRILLFVAGTPMTPVVGCGQVGT